MHIVKNYPKGRAKNKMSTPLIFTDEDASLIKNTLCPTLTNEEFVVFMKICVSHQLNPMMKQIYAIKYGNRVSYITSIDGFRLIAERTGCYAPGKECTFAYDDKNRLLSATAFVKKKTSDGTWHEVATSALLSEYSSSKGLWETKPHIMLAKCAESLALRKAFPAEMSALYTQDEMSPPPVEELNAQQILELEELINGDEQLQKNILLASNKKSLKEIHPSDFESLKKKIILTLEYKKKSQGDQ